MAYPAQSRFDSGALQSAWVVLPATGQVAAAQGLAWVRAAQKNLRDQLGSQAADLVVDGEVGPQTIRALALWAQTRGGASDAALAAIRNVDATGQVDGAVTLAWLVLAALGGAAAGLGAAQIAVPANVVPPPYRQVLPDDGMGGAATAVIFTPPDRGAAGFAPGAQPPVTDTQAPNGRVPLAAGGAGPASGGAKVLVGLSLAGAAGWALFRAFGNRRGAMALRGGT